MKGFFKKYIHDCGGVAATEFALIAPIFAMLLVGTADMGMYILENMRLQNAAHAAASYVAQAQSEENAATVAAEIYNGRGQIDVDTELACECADGVPLVCPASCGADDYQRRFINITINGTFNSLFPYPGLPEEMSLAGYARMRVD